MTTIAYKLQHENLTAKDNQSKLQLIQNLLNTLEIFKGEFSRNSLINLATNSSLPNESVIEDELELESFLKLKLTENILKLPLEIEQKPESKLDIYKQKFEKSSGNIDNAVIIGEFFKDVVWDYSINLFSIMMGAKNPAAELYEFTKSSSELILSNMKRNEVSPEILGNVNEILTKINNQLWVMQKKQRIQNCDDVINFNLAGLILASSFALATLSIVSPLIGIQIGFGSVLSALYLSGGIAILSAISTIMSYSHKADLKMRSNNTFQDIQEMTEEAYEASSLIITPLINFFKNTFGYEEQELLDKNKNEFENMANNFINKNR